jgi:hypothetical protein
VIARVSVERNSSDTRVAKAGGRRCRRFDDTLLPQGLVSASVSFGQVGAAAGEELRIVVSAAHTLFFLFDVRMVLVRPFHYAEIFGAASSWSWRWRKQGVSLGTKFERGWNLGNGTGLEGYA